MTRSNASNKNPSRGVCRVLSQNCVIQFDADCKTMYQWERCINVSLGLEWGWMRGRRWRRRLSPGPGRFFAPLHLCLRTGNLQVVLPLNQLELSHHCWERTRKDKMSSVRDCYWSTAFILHVHDNVRFRDYHTFNRPKNNVPLMAGRLNLVGILFSRHS